MKQQRRHVAGAFQEPIYLWNENCYSVTARFF
jgi:hypothetical protein